MAGLLKHLLFAAACFAVFQGDRRAQVAVEAREVGRVGVPHTTGKIEQERHAILETSNPEIQLSLADERLTAQELRRASVKHWEEDRKAGYPALSIDGVSTSNSPSASSPTAAPTSPSPHTLSSEQEEELGRALIQAAKDEKPEVVRRLLEQGVDVNYSNHAGEYALHHAASNGDLEIIELLLKAGADVNAVADDGLTPLHVASLTGEGDAARALLGAGADLQIEDKVRKWTPLFWASAISHPTVIRILLSAGADPNAKDAIGKTPYDYAKDDETMTLLSSF